MNKEQDFGFKEQDLRYIEGAGYAYEGWNG